MIIKIGNTLNIMDAPAGIEAGIKKRLTFENPKWIENEYMGRWNGETPQQLQFYKRSDDGGLTVPRGFTRQLLQMMNSRGIRYHLEDHRRTLPEVSFSFTGTLKPYQDRACRDILAREFGTLDAPPGSGKTVMALNIITQRRQPTLVTVHTAQLLHQWIERIETFLGIPEKEVGIIGQGKRMIGARITVALVQSLYKRSDEVSPYIGHLVIDECHRCPSRIFTEAVTAFDSKYMLGLSATPYRRDKLSRLIFWHIGDIVHRVDKAALQRNGDILEAEVIVRETNYRTFLDPSEQYSEMLSELTQDQERNRLIAYDVSKEARTGRNACLVLSDRKAHCEALQSLLWREYGVSADVLTGDIPVKEREKIIGRLKKGEREVIVATGQLVGEGFDCKRLTTLFLATPIRFDGRVVQYLGRVLRSAPGKKKAKVYDYCDVHVGVLKAAAKDRRRTLEA